MNLLGISETGINDGNLVTTKINFYDVRTLIAHSAQEKWILFLVFLSRFELFPASPCR